MWIISVFGAAQPQRQRTPVTIGPAGQNRFMSAPRSSLFSRVPGRHDPVHVLPERTELIGERAGPGEMGTGGGNEDDDPPGGASIRRVSEGSS